MNANIKHWERAIETISLAQKKWKTLPDAFITNRFAPENFETPFFSQPDHEIKTIIQWSQE